MKILTINGLYFVRSFRALGHHVLSLGTSPGCDIILSEFLSKRGLLELLQSRGFRPDLVLWCDTCQIPSVFGIESLPSVTMGFSIDQYCNPWHVPYSAAFDCVLVAQKDYLPLFSLDQVRRAVRWFPLFCDPEKDRDTGQERDIPVSFVGTLGGRFNQEREPFLKAFKRMAPLFIFSGDYVPVFNRSRIVLNQSAAGECNFRVFQAMACGALLLTEATGNGLGELFEPGADMLVYPRNDPKAAAAVALKALADPASAQLARRGREKVLAKHTAVHRAKEILALAERMLGSGAAQKRLRQEAAISREMRTAYLFLATDQELALPKTHQDFYRRIAQEEAGQGEE